MLTFAIKKKRTPSIAPKHHAPTVSPMSHYLHLQQAKVRHILRAPTLQPKLTIGQPNDKYEQEADYVADEVMRMPEPGVQRQAEEEEEQEEIIQTKPLAQQITPLVQRQMEEEEEETLQTKPLANQITPLAQVQRQEEPEEEEETLQAKPLADQITPLVQRQVEPEEEEEEEPIQAKFADGAHMQRQEEETEEEPLMTKDISRSTPQIRDDLHSRLNRSRSGGQPLPEADRSFMERRFGVDFSNVRVHTDSNAIQMNRDLNAQAFTHRRDIYIGGGRYSPGTSSGKRLLAHELTHVVQQSGRMLSHPVIQRRVRVNPNAAAVNDILSQFRFLCPGSWSRSGQFVTGNATAVTTHSCTCLEDTVNDPNKTYRINVDPVTNSPRPETLYDGTFEPRLPYPSSGPRTYIGTNPRIHMPLSAGSAMEFGAFEPSGRALWAPNWRILAHELCGHARLNQSYTGTKGDRPEHNSTIETENTIAAEHGGSPRGQYNDTRQGESFHNPTGNQSRLVFRLVDGWHYESSTAIQNPPITTGPIQGRITASALRIRQGPSTSSPILGSYPRGTMITILCQTPGTMVGGNSLWDRTNSGYVSDRYVQRPPSPSRIKLPTCDPMPSPPVGIYGRITASALRIRQGPSTSSPVLGSYPRGTMITILCQTLGTNVRGNSIWDWTNRGYVSDRYVERLPSTGILPPC